MTQHQQQSVNKVSEQVKVWAFPILLSMVAIFGNKALNTLENINQQVIEIRVEQGKSQTRLDGFERRLSSLESNVADLNKQIGKWGN